MPKFIVEQYRLCADQHEVEAENMEEAIQKFTDGEGSYIENSLLDIDVDEVKGFKCGIRSIETPDGEIISHEVLSKMSKKERMTKR